jgi:hypothetical protein
VGEGEGRDREEVMKERTCSWLLHTEQYNNKYIGRGMRCTWNQEKLIWRRRCHWGKTSAYGSILTV